MAVTLTDKAADRVKRFLEERGSGVGLRVAVKPTGCSGFAYVVDYAEAIGTDDHVYDTNGVNVVVDTKSLQYIDGTQIDFFRKGLTEGFQFNNPKVKGECGCGESFAV